ncbi:spore germination protein GerPE [Paenibacillus sp. R14(2021)]|uniref:spore germination protein GerPE n=1 Tax=Paenibacillus sp. R14(2021) TaxID=2859228 RepID=UPI001C6167AD|nr:spore germination protein GerPE [Paenibacillus sp. R14(2021)]
MDEPLSIELLPAEKSDYPVRVSEVGGAYLTSIGSASVVQFGDRADSTPKLRGLAVQRESDHLISKEVYFESYNIYNRQVPPATPWLQAAAKAAPVTMSTFNCNPRISVGCVDIIAISGAALMLVGNGANIKSESRIKNIRQFARPAF